MDWIQGVKWSPSGVLIEAINVEGVERIRPISELQAVIATKGPKKRVRGRLNFSDLRRLNEDEVDDLSSELGIASQGAAQAFFALVIDGKSIVMPAATLMCAMFRPFHGISRYLLAPQGLDSLCIPLGDVPNPEVLFFQYPRSATGMQADKAQGIVNSLSWMYCFPSARRMACSTRVHAMQGCLDIELPVGEMQLVGNVETLPSGRFLLFELRIRLLETSEPPFEGFSRHTKVIEFERCLHKLEPQAKTRYPKDDSIPLRAEDWRLADDEWQCLQDVVVKKQRKCLVADARSMVDLLLEKASQGLGWSDVVPDPGHRDRCRHLLIRMKADGRWEELLGRLRALRSPAELEVSATPS